MPGKVPRDPSSGNTGNHVNKIEPPSPTNPTEYTTFNADPESKAKHNAVDGRNPFRTTLKPWAAIVGWNLQENHNGRAS